MGCDILLSDIAEHPFYSLFLLGIVVLAWVLGAPFSGSSIENKRSAIINKHYNDNFQVKASKLLLGLDLLLHLAVFHLPQGHVYLFNSLV